MPAFTTARGFCHPRLETREGGLVGMSHDSWTNGGDATQGREGGEKWDRVRSTKPRALPRVHGKK